MFSKMFGSKNKRKAKCLAKCLAPRTKGKQNVWLQEQKESKMFSKMFGSKNKRKGSQSNPPPAQDDQVQYRGVEFERRSGKYCARIYDVEEKGKRNNLGTFDSAEEAAMAYDYAARSMHGSNAYTNFVYPDGRQRGSLTNITAPEEPEYELSPDHPAAAAGYNSAAAGYNYDAGGYNYDGGYNSGHQQSYFGQVEYPQWVPGNELPQDLTSLAVGYGGEYFGVEAPPGSSYSGGGGYGNGYGYGW